MTNDLQVSQRVTEAAAKALGYKDWADATDYRLSGQEDQRVANMVQHFAAFERDLLAEREGLREALDRVLASSGARGEWHALKHAEAVENAEKLLAALKDNQP